MMTPGSGVAPFPRGFGAQTVGRRPLAPPGSCRAGSRAGPEEGKIKVQSGFQTFNVKESNFLNTSLSPGNC